MNRLLFVLALAHAAPVGAAAQASFFQDKTIRIVAGYGDGSVEDAWRKMKTADTLGRRKV